ncbi:hypothetical protein HanPI659440_Chr14g0569551 [Helianthus annuus]|nr:hypothetical protein HanPI659440_Chr14g0569551 [Helianthus annuus]
MYTRMFGLQCLHFQQTSTMTTRVAFNLQIKGFCNCKGHMKKLKKALGKLNDVKLLEVDTEMGMFIILTTSATGPDAIKGALKGPFSKKKIILSQKVVRI